MRGDCIMVKKIFPIILILILAWALRTAALTGIPPGLTHDEANHGREALDILGGIFRFIFPLNYGSEPLYSYTVAATMGLVGRSLFSLRLVNVMAGLLGISMTYAWAQRCWRRDVALAAAALMAVSYWPVASSRQALRAGLLPFFMAAAVWFFWVLYRRGRRLQTEGDERGNGRFPASLLWPTLAFSVCVAITLHIYLAARVAWLLFPLFLIYLLWAARRDFRRLWLPTLAGLLLAGLLTTPLLLYVQRNPYALTRLDMLDRPLQDLLSGNVLPLLQNVWAALLAFFWPGAGDTFLAYNIPGRPVFHWVTAVFFLVGVGAALWQWRRPAPLFVLLWFLTGIIPSLVTGPTANSTRNLAALPAIYLLPAFGFVTLAQWVFKDKARPYRRWAPALAVLWLLVVGADTVNDYFRNWGQSPEVRSAYQHTLVDTIDTLIQRRDDAPIIMSTVYPGPAHDASINQVLTAQHPLQQRWVDARFALLLPDQAELLAAIPASTPPHPLFAAWLQPVQTVQMRPDDLDPAYTIYTLAPDSPAQWEVGETAVPFNNAVMLQYAQWQADVYRPGETAELVTVWRVLDPEQVGPVVPPAFTTDVVLFTHVLAANGAILTQRDALDAPSWDWQPGDTIVQVHPLLIPPETGAGAYEAVVGIYDRQSGSRLPVTGGDGHGPDFARVPPLRVTGD